MEAKLLYNIVLLLPYINMNPPQVYTCSQSWSPLPPPYPYHPSGSSQCTSPKHPISCIEPRLAIFSYMIVYMLHCHSPRSSHPLSLPQSPKVCSLHLCLFCCLTYRVIFTIFLNSIYMCWYTVLVFIRPETIKLLEENICKTLSVVVFIRIQNRLYGV